MTDCMSICLFVVIVDWLHIYRTLQTTSLCRIAFDYVRKYSFEAVRVIRLSRNVGKVSTLLTTLSLDVCHDAVLFM
jgi:hypothetical protein